MYVGALSPCACECVRAPHITQHQPVPDCCPTVVCVGTVKDVQLSGPVTDQMALIEFTTQAEAVKALGLNGMKIGDTHSIQVRPKPL